MLEIELFVHAWNGQAKVSQPRLVPFRRIVKHIGKKGRRRKMGVLVFVILVGALLCNLVMPIPKTKPMRKGLPEHIDWSKVVH